MNYTPKQLEILRCIERSQKERGYSPTYAEIARVLEVSPVTVFEHIAALEKKGAIRRRKYEARSLTIADPNWDKLGDAPPEWALLPDALGPAPFSDKKAPELVYRACQEPTLEKALAWIALVETERAIRQAVEYLRTGEPKGGEVPKWDTSFKTLFEHVLKRWREIYGHLDGD